MKLLIIANNVYSGNLDGIGKHARLLSEEFKRKGIDVDVISGETVQYGSLRNIVSMKMSCVFLQAVKRVLNEKYNFIIVEYPFKEHNPVILVFYLLLYFIAQKRKTKVVFSMHEYDRVHIFRKWVINVFLNNCNLVFVSEEKYFKTLAKYSRKMFLRIIPTHISCPQRCKPFHPDKFCYFGLINGAKAFKEMLVAWDKFNIACDKELHIISSSDLKAWDWTQHRNIKLHYNICEEDVSSVLLECAYSIVPILPEVGIINASFLSAVQCGCLPIGKFAQSIQNKSFLIHIEDYYDSFVPALNYTTTIGEDLFYELSKEAVEYGKNFSLSTTVSQMVDVLLSAQ